MPLTIPLTILLATAGLAALAFTLLYLHAAGARRDDLTAFYLADAPDDEANTKPLARVDRAEAAVEASEGV